MSSKGSERTLGVELDRITVSRLRERGRLDDSETIDEVVSGLLDETSVSLPLEEFIDRIVTNGDVAQIAVQKGRIGPLDFIVHSGSGLDEDLFDGVHSVEVDGELYRFCLDVDPYGPNNLGRVTIYTREPFQDINGDLVEGDVENLEEWLDQRYEELGLND